MEISRLQAATILGVTKDRVSALVAEGRLVTLNRPKPGAKRCVLRFDDASVRALKRSWLSDRDGVNGHLFGPKQAPPLEPEPAKDAPPKESQLTIVLALAHMEPEKRELLVKLAQRYTTHELTLLAGL